LERCPARRDEHDHLRFRFRHCARNVAPCGDGKWRWRGLDESLEQAALGLGASRWQAIRRVTLPEIRPSIVTAAVLAFITSFDELVVAMFLAGPQMTLPKKMFDNIRMEIDPTIAAVSVLQILIITAALVIAQRFGRGATAVGVSG
jgi:putative spermidine/putrescine transport system permease protein